MKKYLIPLVLIAALWSCKNKEAEMQQEQEVSNLKNQDSLLGLKTQSQDSTITAYIKSFNDIQDNLDSIKIRQKIITTTSSGGESMDKKSLIISDMRDIESIMMKNRQVIANMERKLKTSGVKNVELEKMIAHLTQELTDKDADIAALQSKLAEVSANYKDMVQKFNDSMDVIKQKNTVIAQQNVIYYAVGSAKELKKRGVIMKEGGVLGVGGTEELKPNTNTKYFIAADMYRIQSIPLYSKLDKIITTHPSGSYTISGNKKVDSLIITDQKAFWSESKYLVIIVK